MILSYLRAQWLMFLRMFFCFLVPYTKTLSSGIQMSKAEVESAAKKANAWSLYPPFPMA